MWLRISYKLPFGTYTVSNNDMLDVDEMNHNKLNIIVCLRLVPLVSICCDVFLTFCMAINVCISQECWMLSELLSSCKKELWLCIHYFILWYCLTNNLEILINRLKSCSTQYHKISNGHAGFPTKLTPNTDEMVPSKENQSGSLHWIGRPACAFDHP